MDAHEQQEKDFLSTMFPGDNQQQSMYSVPYNQQQSMQQQSMPSTMNPQLSMDMLNNLMSMQGIETQTASPTSPTYNAQTLMEQQFKLTQLQQLQQLQNQIFQQQIALISNQTANIMHNSPSVEPRRDLQDRFNGLPTPGDLCSLLDLSTSANLPAGPSAEIHAQQPGMDFVSPIVLSNSYMDSQPPPQEPFRPDLHMAPMNHPHSLNTNFSAPRGSTSAPEHIAFRHNIPSPADLDFDISPLTSPWLGAQQHHHHQQSGIIPFSNANKRSASSSGDEANGMPSRKKQSPAIRPTNPGMPGGSGTKKYFRASRSTNSTPLMQSTRSRRGSVAGDVPGDSPSPVDLSMPPPAPPVPASSDSSSGSSEQVLASPQFNPHLMPVTPASIMKLGRLGINTGMAPPAPAPAPARPARPVVPLRSDAKVKVHPAPVAKPKTTAVKNTRKMSTASGVSPSLKAILPAGSGPHSMNLSSPALHATTPVVQVRKTSHKAAEQKRRDSLKTTFDDLRGLLPPIPLPTDDKFPADEILPGALPPRGPPKAGGEGPNKGVSKLQLLMCGNEYIRVLRARVERRDGEIEKLRGAIRQMNIGAPPIEGDEVDLEGDIDAIEMLGGGILGLGMGGSGGGMVPIGEEDVDDDAVDD
ncbi:hypothetical protein C0991_005733 [Blastosporella zonata]|nr:hypothetical protein C0991_005733 [Blastosporella zonata]